MDNNEIASRVIEYLNEKSGKRFNSKAAGNTEKVVKLLKDGYTEADCRQVIDNMVYHWNDPRMAAYLRPATLFRNGKGKRQFESYLNMAMPEKKQASGQDEELSSLMGLK